MSSVKGALTLFSSNILLSLLNIAMYPLFTRLFDTKEFGELSLFFIWTSVFIGLITGFSFYNFFNTNIESSKKLISYYLGNYIFFFLILFPFSFLGGRLVVVAATSALFMSFGEMGKIYFNRGYDFSNTVKLNSINRVSAHGLKLCWGFFGKFNFSLVFSEVISNIVSSLYFFYCSKIRPVFKLEKSYLKSYGFFFLYGSVNFLVEEWGAIVIAKMYTIDKLGLYFLFSRTVYKPVLLAGNSIASSIIGKLDDKEAFFRVFKKFLILLGGVSFGALVLFFFGEEIFGSLLGESYKGVGEFASTLSFVVIAKFLKGVINVKSAQSGQRKVLIFTKLITILSFIVLTFLFSFDLITLLVILGLIELLMDILILLFLWRKH